MADAALRLATNHNGGGQHPAGPDGSKLPRTAPQDRQTYRSPNQGAA